ncbi:hypothetical protein B0J18DRAFT_436928 [Chaetomium sp. MPI-SDFR-AT-0129]|nr:hypothetical protein B0J18DRAFT_436928 [Chaetomium sp. MPI-SDFR-AT-0129]
MSRRASSNVGYPGLYESDNQKNRPQEEIDELTRHTGENVKGYLPKSQREEANRLQLEETHRLQEAKMKKDPTLAAQLHGNQPAKGAVIDKELQEEDEAALRKKQHKDALPGKKY